MTIVVLGGVFGVGCLILGWVSATWWQRFWEGTPTKRIYGHRHSRARVHRWHRVRRV